MTRFTKALAAAAVVLTLPTMASALGIELVSATSSGASTTLLQPGETITFDLRLENATAQQLFGLDVVVSGYDTPGVTNTNDSHLALAGGAVAGEAFALAPDLGFITGLENQRSAPVEIWDLNQFNPQPNRVALFQGISPGGTTGTGAVDRGVDGGFTVAGDDVHLRVIFAAAPQSIDAETITLNFGVDQSIGHVAVGNGGSILPFNNASYTLTVIPEPGTALLMGLGLAGLAANRRR